MLRSGVDSALTRSRLLAALSGNERLVVIHGGRFVGKSTLLRKWIENCLPPGVISAEIVDPEPGIEEETYWSTILSVLDDNCSQFADSFEALCCFVESCDEPLVLVLDDVHLIDSAEERIRELLRRSARAGVRILASTRTSGRWYEPAGLPAARVLLSSDDLAFTIEEVGELVDATGADVDRHELREFHAETGGLAALVAVAVNRRTAGFVGRGAMAHVRNEIDRVVDHTLSRDARLAAIRKTILRLAVGDRLTDQSARALTEALGTDPAGCTTDASLEELERLGMVDVHVGAPEATWAFSAPVRASLIRLFGVEDPEGLREAQLTLCRYWLERDRVRDAFVCAIDAAHWGMVLEILRDHWRVLYTSDFLYMEHDLARIPSHILDREPLFGTLRRMHQQFSTPKDVPTSVIDIETNAETPEPAERMMRAIALRIAGQFAASVEQCEPLMNWTPPHPDSPQEEKDGFGFAAVHMGISLMTVGRFDDAIELLRRGHRAGAGTFIERDAAGKLALSHAMLGHLSAADEWIAQARSHPPLELRSEMVVRPAGMVAHALTCIDRLDRNGAVGTLAELGLPDDREEFWGFIVHAHGLHCLTSGSPADGLRYVDHQMRRFPTMRDHGAIVGPLLDGVRADLLLALGQPIEAAAMIGDSTHPATAPARARIQLHAGDAAAALGIVNEYVSDVRCTSRDSIELALIGASACVALGDPAKTADYLHRATSMSTLFGLLRPFATLPAEALLTLRGFSADIPELPAGYSGAAAVTFVPNLTERERTILRSLASSATVKQIGTQHFVSTNTIKSQVRSIYRKLGASSRQQAVHRARTLGLLDP